MRWAMCHGLWNVKYGVRTISMTTFSFFLVKFFIVLILLFVYKLAAQWSTSTNPYVSIELPHYNFDPLCTDVDTKSLSILYYYRSVIGITVFHQGSINSSPKWIQFNRHFYSKVIQFSFIYWAQLFVYGVAIRYNSRIWYKSHSIHSSVGDFLYVLFPFVFHFISLFSVIVTLSKRFLIAMAVVLFHVWNAFRFLQFYPFKWKHLSVHLCVLPSETEYPAHCTNKHSH